MFRVYVIKPHPPYKSVFYKMCRAFKYKIIEIANIGKIEIGVKDTIVVFCPDSKDNPDWVKIESLKDFEHPEDSLYVFGTDIDGDVLQEIEDWIPDVKDKIRFVTIPMAKYEKDTNEGVQSIWGCSACAIALYDRFIKRKEYD